MIIVSARKNFVEPDRLLPEGHIIREVDLTNDTTKNEITHNQLLDEVKEKNICILVHGYNNEYFEVNDAYQIMENNIHNKLSDTYQKIIGYSWPGGDQRLDWFNAQSRANAVARRFRHFLESIRPKAKSIDLISHSLGARVSLKALKESQGTLIDNYYCMAGAVDNESLEHGKEFFESRTSAKKIYVLHSAKDGVLATAYRAAEFDNALGLFGPEDKSAVEATESNIYVANCKRVIENHGGYKRSKAVFDYIATTKKGVPQKRYTTL